MVTLVLPRLVSFEGAGRRSSSVVERNLAAMRSAYWVVMATGFLEPVMYLFSIGVGVGSLVGTLPLPDGRMVAYSAFVAPAMLAYSWGIRSLPRVGWVAGFFFLIAGAMRLARFNAQAGTAAYVSPVSVE